MQRYWSNWLIFSYCSLLSAADVGHEGIKKWAVLEVGRYLTIYYSSQVMIKLGLFMHFCTFNQNYECMLYMDVSSTVKFTGHERERLLCPCAFGRQQRWNEMHLTWMKPRQWHICDRHSYTSRVEGIPTERAQSLYCSSGIFSSRRSSKSPVLYTNSILLVVLLSQFCLVWVFISLGIEIWEHWS